MLVKSRVTGKVHLWLWRIKRTVLKSIKNNLIVWLDRCQTKISYQDFVEFSQSCFFISTVATWNSGLGDRNGWFTNWINYFNRLNYLYECVVLHSTDNLSTAEKLETKEIIKGFITYIILRLFHKGSKRVERKQWCFQILQKVAPYLIL